MKEFNGLLQHLITDPVETVCDLITDFLSKLLLPDCFISNNGTIHFPNDDEYAVENQWSTQL